MRLVFLLEDCVFFLPLVFLAASRTLNGVLLDRRHLKNSRIHRESGENEFSGVWALDEYPVHEILGSKKPVGSAKTRDRLISGPALQNAHGHSAPRLELFR